jgi:DNA-binding NtrC family response regulator
MVPVARVGPASDRPRFTMKNIEALIIDDDSQMRLTVELALEGEGFAPMFAATAEEGLEVAKGRNFDVVLLDLHLPGMSGIEMLNSLRDLPQPPETVVLTGRPDLDTAVEAIKLGAYDYLSKPFDAFKLLSTLKNAAAKYRLNRENAALKHTVSRHLPSPGGLVIADSPGMKKVLRVIEKIAPSDASVLIQGETGAGKGLVAKLIHSRSMRSQEPNLHINCSALNDTLLESELFGHEKGSFTGAAMAKPGLFEVADGGTLFLDEVAEMSAAMQAKLLQVLDNGELRRVGGTSFVNVDVRIISATNKDLEREIAEGRFRRDLLFRLNVVNLKLPPLRKRREDIPALVQMYLDRYRLPGEPVKTMTEAAMARLCGYSWPGNVRELANVIEGLVLLAQDSKIDLADLPAALSPSGVTELEAAETEPLPLAEVTKHHLIRTLRYTAGKKAPAARLLGIDVKTLYSKIKAYDIDV